MYAISFHENFEIKLKKIKDKKSKENIIKKIEDIADTLEFKPNHYKNLRSPLQDYKRVHVNVSYVLVFRVDNEKKEVIFVDYEHHKKVYKNKINLN